MTAPRPRGGAHSLWKAGATLLVLVGSSMRSMRVAVRRRLRHWLRGLWGRPGRSLVFTCPHSACGLPWAETRQVFEAMTPAEYVAHCRRLKAEFDAGA